MGILKNPGSLSGFRPVT